MGVGAEGYGWSGQATIRTKQEWPDWYPTKEYVAAHPKVAQFLKPLQSGEGVRGGPENPMGARAMYLSGKKDTLYRIHGTNEPWTIGTNVSAGCIRLTNEDVSDLYNRVPVGAKWWCCPRAASRRPNRPPRLARERPSGSRGNLASRTGR